MAQKRMFDRDVVSSDAFTEMSSDAQSLYFHLGIQADDEGFVAPRGVMRMISAPEDALRVLMAKNFVIPFESGVIVITDWNKNNWLDSRRMMKTQYQNEKKRLILTEDHKYELSNGLASIEEKSIEYMSSGEDNSSKEEPEKYLNFDLEVIEGVVENSFDDGEGNTSVWLERNGKRLRPSETNSLIRCYKARTRKENPKPMSDSVNDVNTFLEAYTAMCKKHTGVAPKYGVKEKAAVSQAIRKYTLLGMGSIAAWFLRSDAPKDKKINVLNVVATYNVNKYQLETGREI